jgi:excisionase family DNA binding protein
VSTQSALPPVTTQPRLLGIKDAARYLGATVWFVRSQLWAANLPYITLGKRFVIDTADLDRFIEAKKAGDL